MDKKVKKSFKLKEEEALVRPSRAKSKFYMSILLVGLALISVSLFMKGSDDKLESADISDLEGDDHAIGDDSAILDDGADEGRIKTLKGVLAVSDDLARGGLKLVSSFGDIYLRTTRDFSRFLGAEVFVITEGTLENFELVDIQPTK